MRASSFFFSMLIGGTLLAQQTFLPGEAEEGRQLFRANCTVCHGPDGDSVGGVDLGRGKFRRAASDDDLIQIVRNGIPGTAMPPQEFSKFEAGNIVAYLRFMASTAGSVYAPGDPVRGRAVFENKGACLDCHRVKSRGSRTGPDLTEIGSLRRSVELERSVLEPNAEVLPPNRTIRLVTKQGTTFTGRLLNRDSFTVQLMDSEERLLSFLTTNLKEYAFVDQSPMPSYKDRFSPDELSDLISYLVSLKGIETQ